MKKLISILMLALFFVGCSVIDETERGVVLSWGKSS
jgi:PBP1b-binding outer membrane lipoprotein LpoB